VNDRWRTKRARSGFQQNRWRLPAFTLANAARTLAFSTKLLPLPVCTLANKACTLRIAAKLLPLSAFTLGNAAFTHRFASKLLPVASVHAQVRIDAASRCLRARW
jgi:hypothetical protein